MFSLSVTDTFISVPDEIVTHILVRKNLLNLFKIVFLLLQLSVRFFLLYSVFNEHVTFFEKKGNQRNFTLFTVQMVEMMGFDSRANCALGLPRL